MRINALRVLFGIALLANVPRGAAAQVPAGTVVVMECSSSGPAAGACIGVGVLLHELSKADGFGPNGEVMKVLRAPVELIAANVPGAKHERGDAAKILRVLTGVSVADIEKYGLQGGPNSEVSKLLRSLGIKL
jgi:hypothetical protein